MARSSRGGPPTPGCSPTDTRDVGGGAAPATADGNEYAGPAAAALAERLDPQTLGNVTPWSPLLAGFALILGFTFLGVLIAGPAPVLGTRWFWFWVVVITPYALGLLFWVLRDRPWAPAELPAGKERDGGVLGVVAGLLSSFVITVLLLGLRWVLGGRWVPV